MVENKTIASPSEEIKKTRIENIIRGYISGFFDAEGHIRLDVDKATISIKQTYKPVLDFINRRFEGGVTKDSLTPIGTHKQAFRWRIYHENSIRFLEYIYPNLIEKRKQAELMLYYLKEVKPVRRDYFRLSERQKQQRDWLRKELERLKHEKYDEKQLINYDNEIKKSKIPKDIREGKQAIIGEEDLIGELSDLYKELRIDENKEIKNDHHYVPDMSKDVFLGYITGFFDGEGHVGIQRGKRDSFVLNIAVANSNFDILNLYNRFGGKIRPKLNKDAKDYYKKLWLWEIQNDKRFLKNIYRFTIVKKEQIFYAIKFQDWHNSIRIINTIEKKKTAEFYRLKIKELKKETGEDDCEPYNGNCVAKINNNPTEDQNYIENAWMY